MKNKSLTVKFITLLFSIAVAAYFVFLAWNYLTASETTATVYSYRAEHTIELNGLVVRDESVVDCTDTLVELTRTEGERVSKGTSLATVYGSAYALEEARELDALRTQREQLQYAKDASRDVESALRLDNEVERSITALHTALAQRDFVALEAASSSLKSTVLRREYAYRGGMDLTQRIDELDEQIRIASASLDGTSRTVSAPFSGTYSAVVDGWESVLSPQMLQALTPSEFEKLAPQSANSTVGKLIRGDRWYYAAVIDEADARGLDVSQSYQMLISGTDALLPVSVSLLSREQEGRRLLILTSDRYLSSVTQLRAQSAELILESHTGLRVPKNALRVGENNQTGVYCRIGRFAYFKPVDILYQGEDYFLVKPGDIHAARESDVVLYTLRVGDEAIITATELYNGKVIH
ncbi:MAG: hypothetical protein IJU66_07505 [Oscillospiraceae bacterium]|nr:hypothetical protein [Oscillospiraceae bacterium]